MLDSVSSTTLLLLGLSAAVLLTASIYPSSLLRWLQRKRYQYEVTFSLYMLTTTEKFIFNTILFLLLSLFIVAASLYLPEHVVLMAKRMFYYCSGDERGLEEAGRAGQQVLENSALMLSSAATEFLGSEARAGEGFAGPLAGQGRGVMEA